MSLKQQTISNPKMKNLYWWRGGIIYQIYPRSFFDSNEDGIGDLPGITQRLNYVASLGVDAIWLSPFFKSPMRDFGYDVSDYRDVDPMFGTLEDFDNLIHTAHTLGLRVLIDQVVSHTSIDHPWFQASRQDQTNDKADWYVWADPSPDGTPPNNWLSVFGGSAWEWEPQRMQFYLHNFLSSQPDLNFHNPDVVHQVLSDMKFWLNRGVDGFRLDTANFYFHDSLLRNNPPRLNNAVSNDVSNRANLYTRQEHIYDKSRPENIGFLQQIRSLLNQYPGATSVGEIGAVNSLELMANYTGGDDKLHMAYSFDLLADQFSVQEILRVLQELEAKIGDGWPCWAMSNHDVSRVATRWGAGKDDRFVNVCLALLLTLRGTVCLYQGEELGLPEADVPYEHIQDPYGIRFWPTFKGRDGCRTPMPWLADQPSAGFSPRASWLPVAETHLPLAVDRQEADPNSALTFLRQLLAWRNKNAVLKTGAIHFFDLADYADLIGFRRADATQGDNYVDLLFNFGDQHVNALLPSQDNGQMQPKATVELPAYSAWYRSSGDDAWQRLV